MWRFSSAVTEVKVSSTRVIAGSISSAARSWNSDSRRRRSASASAGSIRAVLCRPLALRKPRLGALRRAEVDLLRDDVEGPPLDLLVDPPDVLAEDAGHQELRRRAEGDEDHDRRPARHDPVDAQL